MLGTIGFVHARSWQFLALPWIAARSSALLWGWLAGGLAYAYVVVTVERVDYYMSRWCRSARSPSAVRSARFAESVRTADAAPVAR